mmetsp:Transcript_508/g.2376  ORF Transcript_508/g.2376 Transcript_508/m.2376 type:complete len:242 (+) Transcript_508:36-761(+)
MQTEPFTRPPQPYPVQADPVQHVSREHALQEHERVRRDSHRVSRPRSRTSQRQFQLACHRLGFELERVLLVRAVQPRHELLLVEAPERGRRHRGFHPLVEVRHRFFADHCADGAHVEADDLYARLVLQFQPQGVAVRLERELSARVRHSHREDDVAQDARALDDSADVALVSEDLDAAIGQVDPAEEVALEDLPEEPRRDVLGRTAHAVRAVVEERIQGTPGRVQDLLQPALDRLPFGIVD